MPDILHVLTILAICIYIERKFKYANEVEQLAVSVLKCKIGDISLCTQTHTTFAHLIIQLCVCVHLWIRISKIYTISQKICSHSCFCWEHVFRFAFVLWPCGDNWISSNLFSNFLYLSWNCGLYAIISYDAFWKCTQDPFVLCLLCIEIYSLFVLNWIRSRKNGAEQEDDEIGGSKCAIKYVRDKNKSVGWAMGGWECREEWQSCWNLIRSQTGDDWSETCIRNAKLTCNSSILPFAFIQYAVCSAHTHANSTSYKLTKLSLNSSI